MNSHIPKIIHISWKTKDILDIDDVFPRNCIQNVVRLAEGWTPIISDDNDVDLYLKENLSVTDYGLLKDKHVVEKTDVWRLLKMHNEGGLYVDIDRLCNVSINDVLDENTMFVLPECINTDFSQDFMCSAPQNPVFVEALDINLNRRRYGVSDTYLLGPVSYFHAVTKSLTGQMIQHSPDFKTFEVLREVLSQFSFIKTYQEKPPYDTILYRKENGIVEFDHEIEKRNFYAQCNLRHWTNEW